MVPTAAGAEIFNAGMQVRVIEQICEAHLNPEEHSFPYGKRFE